ncbi:hypothetical protein Anapl_00163 [Anas platyrhynchos]|uniref:Uncharacterized protein n=1 Tax=Anas platyrhynchos TaxID=8839 RepID=R0K3B9_ANAPL|nr:hypothetical protein Anapl_00163 [Anas platyrhynchos]
MTDLQLQIENMTKPIAKTAGKNYWVAKLSQETVKGNQGNCSQIDSSKGNQSNKKDGPRIFKAAIISAKKNGSYDTGPECSSSVQQTTSGPGCSSHMKVLTELQHQASSLYYIHHYKRAIQQSLKNVHAVLSFVLAEIRCINYEWLTKYTPVPEAAHQSFSTCRQVIDASPAGASPSAWAENIQCKAKQTVPDGFINIDTEELPL